VYPHEITLSISTHTKLEAILALELAVWLNPKDSATWSSSHRKRQFNILLLCLKYISLLLFVILFYLMREERRERRVKSERRAKSEERRAKSEERRAKSEERRARRARRAKSVKSEKSAKSEKSESGDRRGNNRMLQVKKRWSFFPLCI
jgi:flagellar biosynthesis/type III secretory pathway M-ring protein FliF/YscJ